MPSWLEQELERGLAPVLAPQQLWMRVDPMPAKAQTRARLARWPWAAAGSLAAAALAVVFAFSAPDLSQIAAAQLAGSARPDFASSNAEEISRWLRDHAGVDVRLPEGAKAQIEGACAIKRGGATLGEVIYRAGGRNAILLVSRATKFKAPAEHGQSTWSAHGQVYAMAFDGPSGSHLPCQLCHVD